LLLDALWPPKPGSTPFPFDPHGASATPDPVGRAADFLSIFPHKALATALLKLFRSAFTPRTATITGRVLPAGDRGAGLSLSLTSRHKRRTYSTTIWERLIEPEPAEEGPQRWYRLVTPSAVWLRRYLALVAPGQGADEPDARALWAEARYEAARELSQDSAHARALYARVVDDDPNNLPAVHDLAVTELRADSPEHAVSRLRGLLTSLANDADARARWPMLNMSARYNVAVALLYAAEREDDEPSQ
jgi:hypothetical protein